SSALFIGTTVATQTWVPPQTGIGWAAVAGISVTTTIAIMAVFVSANRGGAVRTPLGVNLQALLAAIGSALLPCGVITPLQALGGAVMLAALMAFQLRG